MDSKSLRQYFAAMALQGMFSGFPLSTEDPTEEDKVDLRKVAKLCWTIADVMMETENENG